MKSARLPRTLLSDPDIPVSAKIVWMVAILDGGHAPDTSTTMTGFAVRSGLARTTVYRAIAQLARSGWPVQVDRLSSPRETRRPVEPDLRPAGATSVISQAAVSVPGELVTDATVRSAAKLLYGALQMTAEFRHPTGRTTYSELSEIANMDDETVRRRLRELAASGWIDLEQEHRRAAVRYTLRNPTVERAAALAAAARRRVERAPFRGEALMREYLTLIIESDRFEDDASPGFLVNPQSGEELQLDRYYPPLEVAFEFNGPQHYRATLRFSREEANRQRTRDHIKTGICLEQGIRLVVVHAEDLSLVGMRRKVGDRLPLRKLEHQGSWIAALESLSGEYRRAAARIQIKC